MKTAETIFEDGGHKWIAIVRDPKRPHYIIDTNEYLIVHDDDAILCDPGGSEIFPAVFSALSAAFDPGKIRGLFASHQDPDVISSLSMWLEFNPEIKCYLSRLWVDFVAHLGGTEKTFVGIPDAGMGILVGRLGLQAVPAHFLHSPGNLHLYDPRARILFCGDVGAALLPPGQDCLYVENFDRHIEHAEGFHRRWMGSNTARRDWCERVSRLNIDMLCPQHGAIYRGEDVGRFIDWFANLEVGILRT